MARIKYSGLVDNIRGSIAGTTFQSSRYGYTVKTKPNMSVPRSIAQNRSKTYLTIAVKAWRELTQTDRDNWNTYATTYPRPSRLNPDSNLNGFNYFTAYHALRFLQTPGNVLDDPAGAQEAFAFLDFEIVLDTGTLTLAYTNTGAFSFFTTLVFISRPIGPAQYANLNLTKFIQGQQSASPIDITGAYTSVFGQLPVEGDRVVLSMTQLNTQNGQWVESPTTVVEIIGP